MSEEKIVSLRGETPEGSGIVNQTLVEMLEKLLEQAKKGEIVALGYFGVKPNLKVFTCWDGCANGYTHQMLAAVSIIQYRMLRMNVPED